MKHFHNSMSMSKENILFICIVAQQLWSNLMISIMQHAGFKPHIWLLLTTYQQSFALAIPACYVLWTGVEQKLSRESLSNGIPLELCSITCRKFISAAYLCCCNMKSTCCNWKTLGHLCCKHFEHVTLDMKVHHCNNLAVTISYTILRLKYGMSTCKQRNIFM